MANVLYIVAALVLLFGGVALLFTASNSQLDVGVVSVTLAFVLFGLGAVLRLLR